MPVLSAPSAKTVKVAYAVLTGSTATGNGVDYTLPRGTLTFLPGQMPPADAIGYMLAFGRRLDLTVDVQGYGAGKIWITLAKN